MAAHVAADVRGYRTESRSERCHQKFQVKISVSQICWEPRQLPVRDASVPDWSSPLFVCYTVTALQDSFPHLRPFMSPAWAVDKRWQLAEPGECRPVLSAPVLKAMTSICLLWQWHRFIGVTLIGFLGMLHPAEFLLLRRCGLLLPGDALHSDPVLYLHITNPKTSRFARRQHCKVDDPLVLRFVTKVFSSLQPTESLFAGRAVAYRRR